MNPVNECPTCGKYIFPPCFSRSASLGPAPTIYLDGSTNYCQCEPAITDALLAPKPPKATQATQHPNRALGTRMR